MTLDKQAVHKAQLPTFPLPAAQCPWQGATCLQPCLEKYSWDNGGNVAQTNTCLDVCGEPLLPLLRPLLLESSQQMPWECSFSRGLGSSLLLTPATSLSTFSVRNQKAPTRISCVHGSNKWQRRVGCWAAAKLQGRGLSRDRAAEFGKSGPLTSPHLSLFGPLQPSY